MVSFICPICKSILKRTNQNYYCTNGHSFDIAKYGYVNLLPSSSQGHHGDDKLMVRARRDFLNEGYYDLLSSAIDEEISKYLKNDSIILDAGCGEGKYAYDLLHAIESSGKSVEIVGIDISKEAIIYASKRSPDFLLAVSSSSSIPLMDEAVDCILNIFSPLILQEFHRVLKNSGILLRVIPLEDHLWELKSLIYDTPYKNEVPKMELSGFNLITYRDVRYQITLNGNDKIMSLFMMTPYYYKTGKKDQNKAKSANILTTHVSFRIIVYMKQ